jgi:hypothetical protein
MTFFVAEYSKSGKTFKVVSHHDKVEEAARARTAVDGLAFRRKGVLQNRPVPPVGYQGTAKWLHRACEVVDT